MYTIVYNRSDTAQHRISHTHARHDRTDNRSMRAISTVRTRCAPPRVPCRANLRAGCASRSSPARRASSPTPDASRAAASRASACCSGSGMNEAHGYAASRSRHRHFCSRCCTISPKPLEETRSACCSRHELCSRPQPETSRRRRRRCPRHPCATRLILNEKAPMARPTHRHGASEGRNPVGPAQCGGR